MWGEIKSSVLALNLSVLLRSSTGAMQEAVGHRNSQEAVCTLGVSIWVSVKAKRVDGIAQQDWTEKDKD